MKILFFGRFNPDYSRNAMLLAGLRLQGAEVEECRIVHRSLFWPIIAAWNLIKRRGSFDVVLVAFPGQEVMPIVWLCTRKPIIFDGFTSHFEGYVQDRRTTPATSLRGRWYWWIDWFACTLATAILTDTHQHALYYAKEFSVSEQKLFPVLLGTTIKNTGFSQQSEPPLIVHFHGSNIPLQGSEVIWGAIRRLWNESITFQIIGPFEIPPELSSHISFYPHVPFDELASFIARAHICLGIFGATAKAQRVIPNKVYEALMCERPVITADTPAIHELLTGEGAVFIKAGDSHALAEAILKLKSNTELRLRSAHAGHQQLLAHVTPSIVGQRIISLCEKLTLRT